MHTLFFASFSITHILSECFQSIIGLEPGSEAVCNNQGARENMTDCWGNADIGFLGGILTPPGDLWWRSSTLNVCCWQNVHCANDP